MCASLEGLGQPKEGIMGRLETRDIGYGGVTSWRWGYDFILGANWSELLRITANWCDRLFLGESGDFAHAAVGEILWFELRIR
jgi:hypothetical protein